MKVPVCEDKSWVAWLQRNLVQNSWKTFFIKKHHLIWRDEVFICTVSCCYTLKWGFRYLLIWNERSISFPQMKCKFLSAQQYWNAEVISYLTDFEPFDLSWSFFQPNEYHLYKTTCFNLQDNVFGHIFLTVDWRWVATDRTLKHATCRGGRH